MNTHIFLNYLKNTIQKNISVYELTSNKQIILISIKKDIKPSDIENLGGEFYGKISQGKK